MLSIPGYTITEHLYESAHTVVCRARGQQDEQPVILKILKAEYPTAAELARYQKEYELLRSLKVAGVIRAYRQEKYHNGVLLVFEDIRGVSLKQVRQTRTLTLAETLAIAIRLAEILGDIHAANIIHKDLNPSNIVYNPITGQLQVIDFGLAAVVAPETPPPEPQDELEGTLAYLAPEQTGRVQRALDYRADYYAFGVTLYELLTGRLPFEMADPLELVHAHLAKRPPSPHELPPPDLTGRAGATRAEVPNVLSAIVLKLLEKNPDDRYQSIASLQADLEQCAGQLQATGRIEDFPIGTEDLAGTFRIPDKLYGREQECARLRRLFEHSAAGCKNIVLCPGAPGSGKSVLLQSLRKPVRAQRGLFLAGKYDLFKRNIPYTGIVQAFQGLTTQLLTESADRLHAWKTAILHALGDNGQVMLEMIPELELILGKQPDVQALPPVEAQNRLNLVFQNFVNVFAQADHPLVLFLDDLQWADPASLQLLEVLLSAPELTYLLFLGAYRDTDVAHNHGLTRMLHNLTQAGLTWEIIAPGALTKDQITRLLNETLWSHSGATASLSALIHAKTEGNAFFTIEFLKMLYTDQLLEFETPPSPTGTDFQKAEAGGWTWDAARIAQAGMTANVVELMTGKLAKLPEQTRRVLEIAAGLGFEFPLPTLAAVCGRPADEIVADLKDVLAQGILSLSAETIKFAHDKVHEAAYAMLSDQERQVLHYRIGQTLLAAYLAHPQNEQIFSLVDQLNQAVALLDETEQRQLVELNLKAGQRAKEAVAYGAAWTYLTNGARLLPDEAWEHSYDLAYTLAIEHAEAAYLNARFDEAEALFGYLRPHARNALDQARVDAMQMPMYLAQTKLAEAFDAGRTALALLGFDLPPEPTPDAILAELARLQYAIGDRPISALAQLPLMTDPAALIAIRCLLYFILLAFLAFPVWYPIISARMVTLSVEYGNCPLSAVAYQNYSHFLMFPDWDLDQAEKFSGLAMALLDQFRLKQLTCIVFSGYGNIIHHWRHPAREALRYLEQSFQNGLETGELSFTSFALYLYGMMSLLTEMPLPAVLATFERLQPLEARTKQAHSLQIFLLFKQTVRNLLGDAADFRRLASAEFDETHYETVMTAGNNLQGLLYLWHQHLLLAYLQGDYAAALNYLRQAEAVLHVGLSTFIVTTCNFLASLTLLAAYPAAAPAEQAAYLQRIAAHQVKMRQWMTWSPENYAHRYWLVEAELARLAGKLPEALDAYDQAIQGASEHDYLLGAALGNELAAKFWLQHGKAKIARTYLTEARYYYQRWGCAPKVRDLETHYAELFAQVIREPGQPEPGSSTSRTGTNLDVASIVKASQTISGEMVLSELLRKLMHIVVENAGAEKGLLISRQEAELIVEARYLAGGPGEVLPEALRLDDCQELPPGLVRYVARTREPLVLNNATAEGVFMHEAYILTHQPRSILCMPILHHQDLTGVLYLEHHQIPGVFTADRITVLTLLASQAAISLENARFYKQMEASERKYRALYEHAVEGIFQITLDGRIITANPAMAGIFGFASPQEMLATAPNLAAQYANPTDRAAIRRLLEETGQVIGFETNLYRKDHTPIWVAVSARVVRDDQGAALYFEGSLVDITARKQAEDAERQRQIAEDANRAKSIFLANMSHELRTPLNAILGFAQLLEHHPALPAQELEYLAIIHRSGEHLLTLVNNVLDLSKIEAGRLTLNEKTCNLAFLLDDLRAMFALRAQNKGLTLVIDCAAEAPRQVWTDEVKLRQVLINLLSNAVKFTKEGRVTLRVETHGGASLRFEVADTGPGIAPEEMDALFEAFTQTATGRQAREGTGLGLAISRKFVELLGGRLTVQSTLGRGAAFTFEILCQSGDATEEPSTASFTRVIALEPEQPVYRLLIADNQSDNRMLLVNLLQPLGFSVREAANGQETLQMWQHWQPQLIWMDVRMPVMDGYEAAQRIRALETGTEGRTWPASGVRFRTVIIAVSASGLENEAALARARGCDDFLRKPFRESEIFALLHTHLGIRFIYAEQTPFSPPAQGQSVLTPEAFAALPEEVHTRFRQAVEALDVNLTTQLIEQIRARNAPLADELMALLTRYRFDILQTVWEQFGKKSEQA